MSDAQIAELLLTLNQAQDKVAVARDHVLTEAGFWQEPQAHAGLFEIQFAGIYGIGPSAEAAVDDWMLQAERKRRFEYDPAD